MIVRIYRLRWSIDRENSHLPVLYLHKNRKATNHRYKPEYPHFSNEATSNLGIYNTFKPDLLEIAGWKLLQKIASSEGTKHERPQVIVLAPHRYQQAGETPSETPSAL